MNEIMFILDDKYATMDYPVKVREISLALGLSESDPSCPATRKKIWEAIKEGNPIGCNGKGYFIIRSDKEMQSYLNSLMRRQIALSERITDVYRAYYGK